MSEVNNIPAIKTSKKEISKYYFNNFKIEEWEDQKTGKQEKGVICLCDQKMTWGGTSVGYENLIRHVQAKHPSYESEVAVLKDLHSQKSVKDFISQPKAVNGHAWLKLIIFCNIPFSMCENEIFRESVKLKDISRSTLVKYLRLTSAQHTRDITEMLPDKFGVMFDGWSIGTQHYLGVFAIWHKHTIMIAISPLGNEENFRAIDHIDHLKYVLGCYNKTLSNVCFLSLDNENTNRSVANRTNIPMIGCAAHRLNLAMDKWIEQIPEIEKVHELMKKLRTLKIAGWLRKLTNLAPEDYNATRWLSTFKMLQKYFRLEPIISADPHIDIADLQLSSREHRSLANMFNQQMKDLYSVQVSIQSDDMKFREVRLLFDQLIEDHGDKITSLKDYLSEDSSFVNDPHFESGILKIMNGKNNFSQEEKVAVKCFEIGTSASILVETGDNENTNLTYAERVLKKQKKNDEVTIISNSNYENIDWIPATNSIVERAFSRGGIILSDLRLRMTPYHFECIMMLYMNKKYWNIGTVTAALATDPQTIDDVDED